MAEALEVAAAASAADSLAARGRAAARPGMVALVSAGAITAAATMGEASGVAASGAGSSAA